MLPGAPYFFMIRLRSFSAAAFVRRFKSVGKILAPIQAMGLSSIAYDAQAGDWIAQIAANFEECLGDEGS